MKKIPTMFVRDWSGDKSRVTAEWNPECLWVRDGEGVATRKIDGTCCLIEDGVLFRRRELKKGEVPPADFRVAGYDDETGKTVGWMPVGDGPEDRYHREAHGAGTSLLDGTYELIGPKIQGNPERADAHRLVPHGDAALVLGANVPRTFDGLRLFLLARDLEGVVWHHPDGRMAKIKGRDFGYRRG